MTQRGTVKEMNNNYDHRTTHFSVIFLTNKYYYFFITEYRQHYLIESCHHTALLALFQSLITVYRNLKSGGH